MTKYFFYAALFYLLFVIYGSLVPLDFKVIPLDEALNQFKNIRYLNLGIGSLADWVANILLMIPLAFLWFTFFTVNAKLPVKLFFTLVIFLACLLLALAIEFTQLFFPPRTVSINDIVAESLGAVIGIVVGWLFGQRFMAWLQQWHQEGRINAFDRYLQIYLLGLFLYAVLPLDLTISPIELYHKWNDGRIILRPFGNLKPDLIENIYQWGSEVVLWIPVPLLWQRKRQFTGLQLCLRVFFAALIIECFQLFVYSRVTDITDIFVALTGGGVGIQLTKYFFDGSPGKVTPTGFFMRLNRLSWWGALFCLGWSMLLMTVFWYPFDFDIDAAFISERKGSFFKIPFYSYYYGTEFRAITEVFHKVLFFIPLGLSLAFVSWTYHFNTISRFISYFWIAFVALGIEAGQILLPDKNADLTDWALEVVGGMIGYVITKQLLMNQPSWQLPTASGLTGQTKQEGSDDLKYWHVAHGAGQTIENAETESEILKMQTWPVLLIWIGVLALALFILGRFSIVPYNVRELISGHYAWLRCFGLSSALFWCLTFPVWFLARMLSKKRESLWYCLLGVWTHSIIAWVLIRLSAPLESVYDVVGSPILANISTEAEIFLRFMALFGIFSLLFFGAVLTTNSVLGCYRHLFRYYVTGLISFIILLPIYYWGVVLEAATDNIIELLPDEGRSWRVTMIALYIFLFAFVGSTCSALLSFKQWHKLMWIVPAVLGSYPFGYLLMQWGTEQFILKYGVVFSALQFLLSTDRSQYVADEVLQLRFFAVHTAGMFVVIITQIPQWQAIHHQRKSSQY